MTDLHRELERQVAKFLGREDAMLFNSGFGGALGTISGLLRKNDVAILDNRSHLSLRDGASLSRCRADKFEHNDPVSLDKALARKQARRQLVVMEGIYSMDGDFGNPPALLDIAESHGASVLSMKRTGCSLAVHCRALRKFGVKVEYRLFTAHFQSFWRRRLAGPETFVTCVYAPCMFIQRFAACCGGGNFESTGNRNARGVAEKLGRMPITFTRNCATSASIPERRYRRVPLVIGDREHARRDSCDGAVCGSPVDYQRCHKTRFVPRVRPPYTRAD
jgi:hypothetical protein